MSEPRLISPMLDNFAMGDPISEHHGIRCCPAMQQDSDKRYIVKILSIPASQVQLDALLLTGAYENEASALSYFRTLSEDVLQEVDILERLSKLEGFVAYEACQTVQMENAVGYDVYLLSQYRRSLARYMHKNPMTHLGLVNLGLDMCAALAVCRQSGYLYVDLKPENIFVTGDHEYRIGDIGFIRLDSLKYASLPDKYRSAYTAPEIQDAFSSINTTIDIYAAGMILYQAYNGGTLPPVSQDEDDTMPAPAYADYEMAEIILKAINPDPGARWQDPVVMGQAIVSYMQRNGVNDDPIVTAMPTEEVQPFEPEADATTADDLEEITVESAEDSQGQICIAQFLEGETEASVAEEEVPAEDDAPLDILLATSDTDNLSFLDDAVSDDTAPDADIVGDISYAEVSDDVSDMLAQADSLIAHETPAPVIPPEPIDVQIPEPVATDADSPEENGAVSFEVTQEDTQETTAEADLETVEPETDEYVDAQPRDPLDKKTGKRLVILLIALVLLGGLVFGGYIFYRDFYLQSVTSMTLSGNDDQLIVNIKTEVDESLLSIVCTDIHGNQLTMPVENGAAVFTGLNPNTLYTVKVKISGLRKLTGEVSQNYTTPSQTNILNFNAVTGTDEGSAIISFNVDGNEPSSWRVTYTADGEDLVTQDFTDHFVTISGLISGKTYTFTLESGDALYLSGTTQVQYTVTAPVYAQDLSLDKLEDGSVRVAWAAPAGITVKNWIVRCYNESGYDKSVTTGETSITFQDIDSTKAHTIEVIAEGMSAGTRTYITNGAITLSKTNHVVANGALTINWEYASVPAGAKWMLLYTIDGGKQQEIVRCDGTNGTIAPVIPGSSYTVRIQLEDGTTVFNGTIIAKIPEAGSFNGYEKGYIVSNVAVQFSMCKQPDATNWSYKDVQAQDYKTTFTPGEKAAFVAYIPSRYNTSGDTIHTLYVIRDEAGKIVSHSGFTAPWRDMWYQRYCELGLSALPETPGRYTVSIYLNGDLAHNQDFMIVG